VKIEKVVEEFLKLLSQEEVEQAEELIMEEAKGREDEAARYLMKVGIGIWDEGYHSVTFCCLVTAEKVAKSEGLVEVIIQNLAIVHNNMVSCSKIWESMKKLNSTIRRVYE